MSYWDSMKGDPRINEAQKRYAEERKQKIQEILPLIRDIDLDLLITTANKPGKGFLGFGSKKLTYEDKKIIADLEELKELKNQLPVNNSNSFDHIGLYSIISSIKSQLNLQLSDNKKYDYLRLAFKGIFDVLDSRTGGRRRYRQRATCRRRSSSRKTRRSHR